MKAIERLIFALDVPDASEADRWIRRLSGSVGLFKVGLELFTAAGPQIFSMIRESGGAAAPGVFLDLKYHDIPKTVERAAAAAARLGARMLTVHCAGGRDMLAAAVAGAAGRVQVLGVTVLTSEGGPVGEMVLSRAELAFGAGLSGVVCSGLEVGRVKERLGPGFLAVTPGVRLAGGEAGDQKRVVTPASALAGGADYIVVGRPIRDAPNPVEAAAAIVRDMEGAARG